jgi:outer membrane lipoprotein-sorting protein
MKKNSLFKILLLSLTFFNYLQAQTDAESLVRKMHKKYHKNFNSNITFLQINQDLDESGKVIHRSMSLEAFHYPSRFRNDNGPIPHKDGYIINSDTTYFFKDGKIISKKYSPKDIGLLTGDIYYMHVEKALQTMKENGYDLTKFREDTWMEKPVFVIGAKNAQDITSPQCWIDKENLYVVRNINYNFENGDLEDVRYLEHTKIEKAWIEERIEIYKKGKLVKTEHYSEVKVNTSIDLNLFNPKKIGTVFWRSMK